MKKGIVMEINDASLTLLTPDGQFLQARRQEHPYSIGEEILFRPISEKKFVNRFLGVKQLSVAAAAVLFIFAGSLIPDYQSNKAYAYMSIDVNPSIELGINKQMQVVKLTAYNSDGKKIISHIGDWEKKSVTELTKNVLKEMKNEGYLNNHHSMVISTVRTVTPDENTEKQLSKNMKQIKELAQQNNLEITVIKGTEKEMEKAHQLGLTTGKYKESKFQSKNKQDKKNNNQTINDKADNDANPIPDNNVNTAVPQGQAENVPNPPLPNNNGMENGNNLQNQIPPGQLKKAEGATEKWNESKKDEQNNLKIQKKIPIINKNQSAEHKQLNGNSKK